MIEQRVALQIELPALFVAQGWNPDRVAFVELVGEVDEGGEVLPGVDRANVHGGSANCFPDPIVYQMRFVKNFSERYLWRQKLKTIIYKHHVITHPYYCYKGENECQYY